MRKTIKCALLPLLAVFCAGLIISSSCFATPPSSLMVIRAADNSLWKATCIANTCGAFSVISGLFGSQPTVSWDDSINGYVLTGRASDNTIWRSTFSSSGVFNNNWVQVPGLTANPPGVASRSLYDWASYTGTEAASVTLTNTAINTPVNIRSLSMVPPNDAGWFQCTATAFVSITRANTAGTNVVFFGLTDASGTLESTSRWTAIDIPTGTLIGMTSIPISVTANFDSSSAASMTFYNTAMWSGTSTTDTIIVRQPAMHCEYYRQ